MLANAGISITTDGGNDPVRMTPTAGGPIFSGTYNYQYQWGYTVGGNSFLNGNYFPNPTLQNIQIPGGTQSLIGLVNQNLGTSLNAAQFSELVYLHELMHMADASGSNKDTIDTNMNNLAILSQCGIN